MTPFPRSAAVTLWLLVVLSCGAYTALQIDRGATFTTNILGLMPFDGREQWIPKLDNDNRLQRDFIILVSHPQADEGLVVANRLLKNLAQQPGIVINNMGDFPAALAAVFKPYRHQVLDPSKRHQIRDKDTDTLARELYASLHSPLRELRLYDFEEDPFNLGGSWLGSLFPDASKIIPGAPPSLNVGGVRWYLLRGTLTESSFNPAVQEGVEKALASVDTTGGVQLLTSGLVFHAAEGTRIARGEIATIGAGSLAGIFILVILTLRSASAIAAMGLTLVTSTLIALTTTLIVFDSIHMITVVFGSTLLGLAVSYNFHFIIKYRRVGDGKTAWLLLRRGLMFSLTASCMAYLMQLVSPFPGLRQFAVFVPAGLAGAFFSVWVLAHCYREYPEIRVIRIPPIYRHWVEPWYLRLGSLPRVLPLTLILLTAGLAIYLLETGFNDDIRLLNTSSLQLLDSERRVQELLGGIETQRFWVVEGADAQQVLESSENVLLTLAQHNGGKTTAMSASQMVPSLRQQKEDFILVNEKLYGPNGAIEKFCSLVKSNCSAWLAYPGAFSDGLIPAAIPANIASYFPVLMLGDEYHGVLLPYRHNQLNPVALNPLTRDKGVYYVDQVERISSILSDFRDEVTRLFVFFLLILATGSIIAYRQRGLLLFICIFFSLTTALASSVGNGITLFHILALLLVLGFSVDTAIFYLELGFSPDTWLASSLSTCTELLAFGLLAFSQVPMLHYFGCVVFTGLMCAWLITPAFYLLATRKNQTNPPCETHDRIH